eukprot:9151862-Pyramimonas_sp.AAC.1
MPRDRSKTVPSGQRAPPGGPEEAKGNSRCLAFSPFRFRWPSEAAGWLQDGPTGLQERLQRAPRRPQERLRALQERPKSAPRGDCLGSRGAALTNARF